MTAKRPNVTVLGSGSWGTTVASTASWNVPTTIWSRDAATVREINTAHTNSRYLGDAQLNELLYATDDLADAVASADVLVLGVPSHAARGVLEEAAQHLRPWVPVVSLVKGLEQGTRLRMTQIIDALLPSNPAGVLAGPNIAKEVIAGYAAAATLAMSDHRTAATLQDLFRSNRFRVYTNTDVIGVEVAGALKNVFAIATGFGDGLDAGDNTRAMVMTRSLHELTRLGVAMGGEARTFAGLAGVGDLVTTCTSPHSRNRRVGIGVAQGKSVQAVCDEMGQVAEGIKSSSVVVQLAHEHGIEMRIASEVDAVINEGQAVATAYRGLLRQPPGHEVHGEAW